LPDLLRMLRASIAALTDRSRPPEPAARQLGYIILGTLPVGIAGIVFKHAIEGSLRSLWVISGALIIVALLLAFIERAARHSRDFDDITLRDAMIIGCAQALALVPGVSRSGITLVAALAIGLRRDAAARFSFLLGVPAIAAAGIFELKPLLKAHDLNVPALAIGLLAAAGAGYISIAWLLRFLRARTTMPFVIYRIALGVLLFALLFAGRVAP
jgi:undecaprenyl-diphosphatase